jgi:hypothetical protein
MQRGRNRQLGRLFFTALLIGAVVPPPLVTGCATGSPACCGIGDPYNTYGAFTSRAHLEAAINCNYSPSTAGDNCGYFGAFTSWTVALQTLYG